MTFKVTEPTIHIIDLRTRMPFKFGIAIMTDVPHVFVRVRVQSGGKSALGLAGDLLAPKWFDKNPDTTLAHDQRVMAEVIEQACLIAQDIPESESFFDWWKILDHRMRIWASQVGHPPLLASFGISLVERAALEAFCREEGMPLEAVLRQNRLDLRLGELRLETGNIEPGSVLAPKPSARLHIRHTVGLLDALEEGDIPAAERLTDGLPQSLDACISYYGLRYFKIKVQGKPAEDMERLRRVWKVLQAKAPYDLRLTLDGNEQFKTVDSFRSFWELLLAEPALAGFRERLLFVEQPLHRSVALSPLAGRDLKAWKARPPMIIDESDADFDSLPTALAGGYIGTSHKNCKGIIKGLANAALIRDLKRRNPESQAVLSGEDLTNVGPVALLQDLTLMSLLGVGHVERNGHHYFSGLSQFPKTVWDEILKHHPDLYKASPAGWPALNVVNGSIQIDSLLGAPLGVGFELNFEGFLKLEAWRRKLA